MSFNAFDEDIEVAGIIRSLRADPRISNVWTELDTAGHRLWLARGMDGHPWLLASDSLARFRQMISELGGQP